MAVLHLSVVSADAARVPQALGKEDDLECRENAPIEDPVAEMAQQRAHNERNTQRTEGAAGLLAVRKWPALHRLSVRPVPTRKLWGFAPLGWCFWWANNIIRRVRGDEYVGPSPLAGN